MSVCILIIKEFLIHINKKMIIQFSPKIELSSWHQNGSYMHPIWGRKLIPYQDYDEVIIISVRMLDTTNWYANFYSELAFLHKYFPQSVEGDLEFAKNEVDNFLIRMSKLVPFF